MSPPFLAGKGVRLVVQLLVRDYGKGFGVKNLQRMIQFAGKFPEERIVVSLKERIAEYVVKLRQGK